MLVVAVLVVRVAVGRRVGCRARVWPVGCRFAPTSALDGHRGPRRPCRGRLAGAGCGARGCSRGCRATSARWRDRVADVVTPRLIRRAAGAVLGVGLVAGRRARGVGGRALTARAVVHAAPAPLPDPGFAPCPTPASLPCPTPPPRPRPPSAPLPCPTPDRAPPAPAPTTPAAGWVPDPPLVRAQPDVRVLSPAPAAECERDAPAEVVVRRGDSLWSHRGATPRARRLGRRDRAGVAGLVRGEPRGRR